MRRRSKATWNCVKDPTSARVIHDDLPRHPPISEAELHLIMWALGPEIDRILGAQGTYSKAS